MGNQSRQGKLKDILNIKSPPIGGTVATRRTKAEDAPVGKNIPWQLQL